MEDYKIFKIHWVDSTISHGWVYKSDYKAADLNVYGIGYLIHEDENSYTFTPHIGDCCFDSPMCIPKQAIINMKEIINETN